MSEHPPTRPFDALRRREPVRRRIGILALLALVGGAVSIEAADRPEEDARTRASSSSEGKLFRLGLPWAHAVERTDANALFVVLQQGGLIDARVELPALRDGGTDFLRPIASVTAPPVLRARLTIAFALALDQLNTHERCRGLFSRLGASGQVTLATTIYVASTGQPALRLCDRAGGAAYTWLGQATTYVCPTFAHLHPRTAAMALLHEALHYAGLPERPVHPGAMSSSEISALVRDRCGL